MERYDINEKFTGKKNTHACTCRACGVELKPGQGIEIAVRWHDWDNPDEGAQGQYESEFVYECEYATDCARRIVASGDNVEALLKIARNYENLGDLAIQARQILSEISTMHQQMAKADDAVARENGYGAIGRY